MGMEQHPEKSLKIVMAVANNSYPADTRVRNEAQSLAAAGHQLTVIAPRAHRQSRQEVLNGVHVFRYPAPPNGLGKISYAIEFFYVTLATSLAVLFIWLRHGLDVVHLHNPPDTLFVASLIPKLFGKKLVFDHHDLAPELYLAKFEVEDGLLYRLLLLLESLSCKVANRLIVVNRSYLCNDVERNGVAPEHITIVRNAPPLAFTEPFEPDNEISNRAAIVVGYLGNIAHQDGVDHMIKALHHVQADFGFDDWYAVIIGPAENAESLRQLAEELGIAGKIWFAGFQPEAQWRKLLASVDICFVPDPASPLNDKSTMIKMMDYMALGKAVIAYDLTENQVSGGDAALYAKASEPKDMARQFMRLAEDPSLREQMGEIGKQRIRDGLAWEYSVQNLLSLYQSDLFY
jgi:glycosyltransferase involved in cell wall biosynthesis